MTDRNTLRLQPWTRSIVAAAGQAVLFGLFVESLSLFVDDVGAFGSRFTVLLCGFATWLICVGRSANQGIWRFVLAGYLAVALDMTMTLAITTTVLMGRVELSAIATATAAALPLALPIWGTLMAAVSIAYGLALNRLQGAASGLD